MIKWIRDKLAKRLIKKVIKHVSKGNPYVLAAVKAYEVHEYLVESGVVTPGKKRWNSKKNKWVYHSGK